MSISHHLSPERRMQRAAFLAMRKRKGQSDLSQAKLRQYGACCHEMALWLRAHGLAHTVAIFATESASNEAATASRPIEFMVDFLSVLDAGFPLGLAGPDPKQRLATWHRQLCGTQPMELRTYIAQARMALTAADVMKSMVELALGMDRSNDGAEEADDSALAAGVNHA